MAIAVIHAAALLAFVTSAGCGNEAAPEQSARTDSVGTVTVAIDPGQGDPQIIEVPDVPDGATLETVMRSLEAVPIQISGAGSTAFVNSLAGVRTSGNEGWTFKVDGEHANQGIGSTVLHPPTTVQWSFGSFEDTLQ